MKHLLGFGVVVLCACAVVGCRDRPNRLRVDAAVSPAPASSLLPQVTALAGGRVAASWLEPLAQGGYRFQMSVHDGQRWSEPRPIAAGPDLIMFTADLPGVVEMQPGRLLAYWQRKDSSGPDPYATTIQLAQTTDEGRSWSTPLVPHRDGMSGSHSFLAAFPSAGRAGVVWLDGQHQQYRPGATADAKGDWMGAMGLRYASVDASGALHDDQFIDPITCDCCPNASAVTGRGPVVAFRDRVAPAGAKPEEVGPDAGTVRDIYVARLEQGRWRPPVRVHADDWVASACPDNGPALDAAGDALIVAWWTMAGGAPQVKVAFSSDAGDTFAAPVRVDRGTGNGQVTVALLPDGRSAVVGWLEDRQTWARMVRADGPSGEPVALGPSPSRNRLPRWTATPEGVLALWTREDGGTLSVRSATLRVER